MKNFAACLALIMVSSFSSALAVDTDEIPALITTLREGDENARIAAKQALAVAGPEVVGPLLSLVTEDDPKLAQAARQTLRWLVLKWSNTPSRRQQVCAPLVECARGKADPSARRLALQLLGIAGDGTIVPEVAELLHDPVVAEAACRALEHIPGTEAVAALTVALAEAEPSLQVSLLHALAVRPDKRAASDVVTLLANDDPAVRAAAAETLGRIGAPKTIEVLLEAARDKDTAVHHAAIDSALRIARGLAESGGKGQAAKVYESILEVARTEADFIGAITGLGELAQPRTTGVMRRFLASDSHRVRVAAINALSRTPGTTATKLLASQLADESPRIVLAVLQILGARGDAEALSAIRPLAASQNTEIRARALWALGHLGSDEAIPDLQAALNDDNGDVRLAARDACLHLAADLASRNQLGPARQIYESLVKLDDHGTHWSQALEGLARIGSAESLPLLANLIQSATGNAQTQAFNAYIAICRSLTEQGEKTVAIDAYKAALKWVPELGGLEGPELDAAWAKRSAIAEGLAAAGGVGFAKDIYRTALEVLPADDRLAEAVRKLQELGEPIDLAQAEGFIRYWWVIGPFPNDNWSAWDTSFFPEDEVDLSQKYDFEGTRMSWRRAATDDILELSGLFGGGTAAEHKACYAYAEFVVEKTQPVVLKVGSDDAIRCWLNGKQIHANRVDRGCARDQDVVTAEVQAGVNRLLCKVLNNAGGWACCVRLCDERGRPLKFTQPADDAGKAKIPFKTLRLSDGSDLVECCTVFDVNKDGRPDIISGAYWYEAPDWQPHQFRELTNDGNYANDWADLALDVNGDGWTDVVSGGFHSEEILWFENPRGKNDLWEKHLVFKRRQFYETMLLIDIDGDGQGDLLPNDGAPIRWYELAREEDDEPEWIEHIVGQKGAGHGIGYGDVDADGHLDIITPTGWYEAPDEAREGEWTWHPEFNLGATSVPILATDIDGDGLSDIIWGLGHDYGLFWLQQKRTDDQRSWEKYPIDTSFSQAHAPALADMDGDGDLDLIAGKRWKAHCGRDPGSNDPICVYWYEYDSTASSWKRWGVSYNDGAGIGLQQSIVDIDGDGDLDIVSACKTGLHLFINESKPTRQ